MRTSILLASVAFFATASFSGTAVAAPTQATGGVCEQLPIPDGERGSTLTGDIDGDGRVDEVSTYHVDDEEATIRVDFAAGGAAQTPAPVGFFDVHAPVSSYDVDSDGDDEILAIGRSAFGESGSLLTYESCALPVVQFSGEDFIFDRWLHEELLSGAECREGVAGADFRTYAGIVQGLAKDPGAIDPGDVIYRVTDYALVGTQMEVVATSELVTDYEDPFTDEVFAVRCGTVDGSPIGGVQTGMGGMSPTAAISAPQQAGSAVSALVAWLSGLRG